jgi:hypothetical protein
MTDQAQEIPMHRERPVISESPDELTSYPYLVQAFHLIQAIRVVCS